ncbi:MAG: flagellar biosynthesis anti-sigma factor FlgM [Solirubrobacteraceae bacterium]
MEDRKKVTDIKQKVQYGEYQVDPTAVADAILRRLCEVARARSERASLHRQSTPPNGRLRAGARIRT